MTFMPGSLLWRTLLVLIAALVLSQAAAIYLLHEFVTYPRMRIGIGQFVSHLKTVNAALQTMGEEQQREFIARIAENEGIRITPVRGTERMRPAADVPPVQFFRERIRAMFGPQADVYVRADGPRPGQVLWVRLPAGAREYWVAFPRGRIERDTATAFVTWGAVGLAIAILATFFIMWRLTRPLEELARAAERLGKGETPPPVAEHGPGEVRALTRAFNQMTQDLQRSDRDRATFLAGISHDLRTPLARLRLDVEMLHDRVEPEVQRGMIADLADMNAIIDQFIDFTRAESAEPLAAVNLSELAKACAERAARAGAAVRCELADTPLLMMRPLSMQRLIDNLLGNAAKHAGGEIVLRTSFGSGEAALCVLDRGPGIPPALAERLKQPFTRRDESRTGSSGAGLGLAIANRIAALHGGRLELLPRDGGGLEARVTLPCHPSTGPARC
jgi:two-component system osmolarity sensor histidine kinase EnvZ